MHIKCLHGESKGDNIDFNHTSFKMNQSQSLFGYTQQNLQHRALSIVNAVSAGHKIHLQIQRSINPIHDLKSVYGPLRSTADAGLFYGQLVFRERVGYESAREVEIVAEGALNTILVSIQEGNTDAERAKAHEKARLSLYKNIDLVGISMGGSNYDHTNPGGMRPTALCVAGMMTLLNTGMTTIRAGDIVMWNLPKFDRQVSQGARDGSVRLDPGTRIIETIAITDENLDHVYDDEDLQEFLSGGEMASILATILSPFFFENDGTPRGPHVNAYNDANGNIAEMSRAINDGKNEFLANLYAFENVNKRFMLAVGKEIAKELFKVEEKGKTAKRLPVMDDMKNLLSRFSAFEIQNTGARIVGIAQNTGDSGRRFDVMVTPSARTITSRAMAKKYYNMRPVYEA